MTALVAAGYQVYAINPLAASRYRDRHNVGGAKSDAGDAKMLADLVRTDYHNHRQIAGDTPEAEAIRIMARGNQNLIWTRNRQRTRCAAACASTTRQRWKHSLTWPTATRWGYWSRRRHQRPASG